MPVINRIRVNNIKYNFGTQYYDDFTMRMYGRNTIYDLANGGGKSVLMLLLMQNLIPNSTLDDKQPIEKLFREGCNNTTIHSLIEWKLDNVGGADEYKYMTTGFCARKARDRSAEGVAQEAETSSGGASGVASIEYFNYCIFYNSYNKNDIINLPLVKDKEHISYQALRNYLLDLSHKNIELKVQIFDKKGEYQRFISGYGLHESQWEIVRGINKTEGHVRTYFETNYKTTRKVIEDLLIEEIIDKAFLVRTNKDEESKNGMARLLISIRDQLKSLAEKKRDIASYDHQSELIRLLYDRVRSFESIFRDKDSIEQSLADIYITVKQENEAAEKERESLEEAIEDASKGKQKVTEQLEQLKISIDMNLLDALTENIAECSAKVEKSRAVYSEDERKLTLAEAGNEYLEYLEEKKRRDTIEEKIKLLDQSVGGESDTAFLAANIKRHIDAELTAMDSSIRAGEEALAKLEEETALHEKELLEARTNIAVAESVEASAASNTELIRKQLSELLSELSDKSLEDFAAKLGRLSKEKLSLEEEEKRLSEEKNTVSADIREADEELREGQIDMMRVKLRREDAEQEKKLLTENRSRLETLARIYLGGDDKDISKLEETVYEKVKNLSADLRGKEKRLSELSNRLKDIQEGRLIETTEGVEKVLAYLRTRHNIFAMSGMDYIASLPEDKRREALQHAPELPYGVVTGDFDKVRHDQNIGDIDTGSEVVIIYNEDETSGGEVIVSGTSMMLLHRDREFFIDEKVKEKLGAEKQAEIDILSDEIRSLRDMTDVAEEDLGFIRTLTGKNILGSAEEADRLASEENRLILAKREIEARKGKSTEKLAELDKELIALTDKKKILDSDILILKRGLELSTLSENDTKRAEEAAKDRQRLSRMLESLEEQKRQSVSKEAELRSRLGREKQDRAALQDKWNSKYLPYYREGEYKESNDSLRYLEAAFDVSVSKYADKNKEQESLRQFSETLLGSMDRILKNIARKGQELPEYLKAEQLAGRLYFTDEEATVLLRNNAEADRKALAISEKELADKRSEYDRLSGRIDYAVKNYTDAFGDFERLPGDSSALSDMQKTLELQLSDIRKKYDEDRKKLSDFDKKRRESENIFKDVSRIVERNNIDTSKAVPVSKEDLREDAFEDVLVQYDNIQKSMDKARLELVRHKGRISESLSDMGVSGLATAVREDVQIPSSLADAENLLQSLGSMLEVIGIEKDRVSKSLQDMELLHDSFVDQCLDRCLDVKTELEMLPGLSGIMLDGEKIEMIRLSIPYVKDEFMRERMAAYIDRVVDEADKIDDDEGRLKLIRNSLSTKRLFGVIVTDMNKIKLSLYKRERIKEQSRYLKYEEAVGSTGQSQGIYIQFLISIINYISGMYAPEKIGEGTNTIFIDNPFGAAKDIYIWEPIFALLSGNRVQLVVPARGASPAITGRFDINYVLGQQKRGDKEVTVVVNYESRTTEEELEYHELSYEQQTFEFI
jgi:hypothetical protein